MATNEGGHARAGAREIRPAVIPALRLSAALLTILGALLLAVPAVTYAGGTAPAGLDRWIQPRVNTPAGAWQTALAVDWIGEPIGRSLAVLLVMALCLLAGRRRLAVAAFIGMGVVTVLSTVLKDIVDRRIHDDFLSYPSGHTAAATAVCVVLGLLLSDLLTLGQVFGTALVLGLALAGGAAMAYAQIDLTAHYPTDTIGGFGLALMAVPATALLVDKLAGHR
ncbi:phosphatase PAP2 family protein [Kribbella sancticallisti]